MDSNLHTHRHETLHPTNAVLQLSLFHVIKYGFTFQYGNILPKELGLFFGKSKEGNFKLKDYCMYSM